MESIFETVIIVLLLLAAITHLIRLINLFLTKKIFSKVEFLSKPIPGRFQLVTYYLLVILVCIYAIWLKIQNQ